MPDKWVDWSKNVRSKDYRGSSSFATFMIIGPVCFFLGILFAEFPYDYPLLWTSDPILPAYLDQLETHLKFVHQSPPLISRMLSIMIGTGFCGFFIKLFKASESNMLFDGASLVLYVIGVGVYIANIVKGLRFVSAGIWHSPDFAGNLPPSAQMTQETDGRIVLGREDSLKVMAASNTILALVLVGVLVLQAGQWYAERKDNEEYERVQNEAATAAEKDSGNGQSSPPTAAEKRANKKKQ
ncbi:secretory component protein-like protein [Xylaria bambusicola]|uniref:secretory component protein-like protein n=1 Tax=Xylaria bambusicola TaxID=326684 RepID=UPI002007569B|nr:secretory component protein-like protein [Xylaria bambusicola]KAI0506105.1 secretory component protein-like protein [Xylaria bambusicola]